MRTTPRQAKLAPTVFLFVLRRWSQIHPGSSVANWVLERSWSARFSLSLKRAKAAFGLAAAVCPFGAMDSRLTTRNDSLRMQARLTQEPGFNRAREKISTGASFCFKIQRSCRIRLKSKENLITNGIWRCNGNTLIPA